MMAVVFPSPAASQYSRAYNVRNNSASCYLFLSYKATGFEPLVTTANAAAP